MKKKNPARVGSGGAATEHWGRQHHHHHQFWLAKSNGGGVLELASSPPAGNRAPSPAKSISSIATKNQREAPTSPAPPALSLKLCCSSLDPPGGRELTRSGSGGGVFPHRETKEKPDDRRAFFPLLSPGSRAFSQPSGVSRAR
ncbi:hypothetical protein CesoFtcFv8_008321 [Champsocephalus esox]|uniref:Uncharacterized protein n=2 Tax=Champsocephalus TaxID=52236 RepID=A0AAN8DMV1_CHAGU|nr:hypothetical protein CesoFtcFv8_008321 [Champsocephalus esox]KAK5925901.1 hypothetical protein CgunFtcFv8_021516 [Champsocephalus gunnari]